MGKNKIPPDPNSNPYRVRRSPYSQPQQNSPPPPPNSNAYLIDFNTQRVCPSCGKIIKIEHNFCKYCGVDLSEIPPIGNTDDISRELAITAATDPDPVVRKEALDTLGSFGEKKILGVLTYVLLHDPDDEVRKEAADELGDLHHPYSLNALKIALKDKSPEVRKEAIEGLKKIKKKTSEKKMDKGKPEEREKDKDKIKEENIKTEEDFEL